jgi:hypothetical protein
VAFILQTEFHTAEINYVNMLEGWKKSYLKEGFEVWSAGKEDCWKAFRKDGMTKGDDNGEDCYRHGIN